MKITAGLKLLYFSPFEKAQYGKKKKIGRVTLQQSNLIDTASARWSRLMSRTMCQLSQVLTPKMTTKRRNNSHAQQSYSHVQPVHCTNSAQCVLNGPIKAIQKFTTENRVEAAAIKDISEASVLCLGASPAVLTLRLHYCMSCASHRHRNHSREAQMDQTPRPQFRSAEAAP